jgi:hypothetical protein
MIYIRCGFRKNLLYLHERCVDRMIAIELAQVLIVHNMNLPNLHRSKVHKD